MEDLKILRGKNTACVIFRRRILLLSLLRDECANLLDRYCTTPSGWPDHFNVTSGCFLSLISSGMVQCDGRRKHAPNRSPTLSEGEEGAFYYQINP